MCVTVSYSIAYSFSLCFFQNTNDTELWLYSALNLSLVYLYSNKYQNLVELADRLSPDKVQTQSTAYSACSHFIRSLKLFCTRNYQEAQ